MKSIEDIILLASWPTVVASLRWIEQTADDGVSSGQTARLNSCQGATYNIYIYIYIYIYLICIYLDDIQRMNLHDVHCHWWIQRGGPNLPKRVEHCWNFRSWNIYV